MDAKVDSDSKGTGKPAWSRHSSFVHSTDVVQEAGACLSIGDDIGQHDDLEDDVIVAAVFTESEVERGRMMYEREHRTGMDTFTGTSSFTDVYSDLTDPTDPSFHADIHESYRVKKRPGKPKSSSTVKVKKLDLSSMLDRCGGDLGLLNSVLDRWMPMFIFFHSRAAHHTFVEFGTVSAAFSSKGVFGSMR
jgi:hypothetical protein